MVATAQIGAPVGRLYASAVVSWFEAIVLGITQGLTEFLPISSTAHLRIVPAFAGWDDPGAAFTAVVQLGTLAAVLLYFREDLWRIARASLTALRDPRERRSTDARLGLYIVLGTIPISLFGLIFKDQIENGARNLTLIGCTLIVLGLLLLAAERMASHRRAIDDLRARDGWIIGLAQAAALVPGVPRSCCRACSNCATSARAATPQRCRRRSRRSPRSSSATPRSPSCCAISRRTPRCCSWCIASSSGSSCWPSWPPAPSVRAADAPPAARQAGSVNQKRLPPPGAG